MTVKFTNNASATLATSINTSVTTIAVTAGQGSQFPSLTNGEFFYATLVDGSNNIEIVKVTARSSDTLTVVRGQDNTTAKSYLAGDKIELRIVAASLNAIISDTTTAFQAADATITTNLNNHITDASDAHDASAISFSPAGNLAATDVQAAIAELDTEKLAATATVSGADGITVSGTLGSGATISPSAGYNGHGARTVSTSAPSGGSNGDIWYKV